jgi:hypothetical protein
MLNNLFGSILYWLYIIFMISFITPSLIIIILLNIFIIRPNY